MPRPTRYDRPTVRLTIYVHPDTAALLAKWTAGAGNRSPGMWVDDMARRTLGSQNPPEAFRAPAEPMYDLHSGRSLKDQGWTVDPQSGDFIPPAGMNEEQAKARWRQIVGAPRSPSPAERFVPHKANTGGSGMVVCRECGALQTNRAKWTASCPGAPS